ncbi:hypothetical protein GF360_00680 [candidate division WWE3 bacterium]|nr:hypothetical protein [candidate division WWE3 bacterium]
MFEYVVSGNGIPDPGYNSVGEFFGVAINLFMGVGISLSIIFIGLAGIRFVTAGGNPDNMERARHSLTYAIVALVLSVGAIALKYIIVNSILGVSGGDLEGAVPTF